MDNIAKSAGVAVPGKDIDCRDNELIHPRFVARYARAYARLTGKSIGSSAELIEAFYNYHADVNIAGFKTMFNRHSDLKQFILREDIQFITLTRRDIPATVASFMLAMEQQTWRRHGGRSTQEWTFSDKNMDRVNANLEYIYTSNMVLRSVPDAIALHYEDLCHSEFQNPRLDAYFGRHVALDQPAPPTDASHYVSNWEAFVFFLQKRWEELNSRAKDEDG